MCLSHHFSWLLYGSVWYFHVNHWFIFGVSRKCFHHFPSVVFQERAQVLLFFRRTRAAQRNKNMLRDSGNHQTLDVLVIIRNLLKLIPPIWLAPIYESLVFCSSFGCQLNHHKSPRLLVKIHQVTSMSTGRDAISSFWGSPEFGPECGGIQCRLGRGGKIPGINMYFHGEHHRPIVYKWSLPS